MKIQFNSFYSHKELKKIGIKSYGDNVFISKKASIYNPDRLIIGNNVRIDDFCILTGHIKIGSYVHISAYCGLYGKNSIKINDFSGTSPRTTILSATDDFGGEYLIGPMVPKELTNVMGGPVILEKYVQIGAGCVIFPNVTLNEGVVVGAMSLINKSIIDEWVIYAGIPAKFLKYREKKILVKAENINN